MMIPEGDSLPVSLTVRLDVPLRGPKVLPSLEEGLRGYWASVLLRGDPLNFCVIKSSLRSPLVHIQTLDVKHYLKVHLKTLKEFLVVKPMEGMLSSIP
jgi:hypothetical protein